MLFHRIRGKVVTGGLSEKYAKNLKITLISGGIFHAISYHYRIRKHNMSACSAEKE